MSSPVRHAESSVLLHGGSVSDYLNIHSWFDRSKEHMPDIRHRALFHNSFGVFQCEREFGEYITIMRNGSTHRVPTRIIAEQHIVEDVGFLPTVSDWLSLMPIEGWMKQGARYTNRLDLSGGK